MAGNTLFLDVCDQVQKILPKMQDRKLLTHHRRIFGDGAGSVLSVLLPVKMTNTIIINNYYQITLKSPCKE
jgi:hypothetical protein